MGPLKDDWTSTCPLDWPQSERDEKCISQNEASWGTAMLSRLEKFKAIIDPNELFICAAGVGYTSKSDPSSNPDPSPSSSSESRMMPNPMSVLVFFLCSFAVSLMNYCFLHSNH
ncbi:hypothetical protein IV203_033927 [Nitzschia inconspicua]|uniref:Uncharacterized protein n=1 Tax=Nitzschia inconspicua TaxID=303405 RepID=A0A9K3M3S3_9STRA|nr:hypothetical protein IV203_033927 [Nitzschia inconspicua]